MKIAIASDDGRTIAAHFGRTLGFVVVEVEGGEVRAREYRPNTFTGHARGLKGVQGMDRHGPILEALKDCQAVIAHGMGWKIHEHLRSAGIEGIITDETSVDEALSLYLKGELEDRTERLD